MKKIVHKPAAPLYAAAAAWVLYALLFPLYRPGHFVIALAASAVVYGIARLFCKDIVEEVPQEPKTTGNPELDQMVSEGQGALDEMRRLNDSIQDAAISAQIERLSQVSGKIFQQVQKNPTQLPQIRKFMSYYLPTTLKLLRAYDDMSRQGVQGENITGTMERVRGMMSTIVTAFERQLDSLFGDQALDISTDITVLDNMMASTVISVEISRDISTDITVLDNMMAREGLSDDPIHRTQAKPDDGPQDDGIQLEL